MNYQRLRNGYRCQRNRGKSHCQIGFELLAKFMENSSAASMLMRVSLQRHGLRSNIGAAEVLERPRACAQRLHQNGIISGRFFLDLADQEVWRRYRGVFAHKIHNVIEDSERICRHEFNLLGSGLSFVGTPIDWHVDPVSGYRWPKKLFSELKRASPSGTDMKLPWELSRMQHLPTLGKAYWLAQDERYAGEIVEQITHWIDDNPCPYGVNWLCPMDVAIRIMNILWAYLFVKDSPAVSDDFRRRLAVSIFQHGQHILFNLEYGCGNDGSIVNGNHYLTDVIGLLHLGVLCPEFKMADKWRSVGVQALIEEMDRQVNPDGINFESSVAYHRLVLELFTAGALLCLRNGITLPGQFWERLERMFEFVLYVTRPDGNIPVVGDADDGRLFILSDYGDWNRRDFRYLLSVGAVLFKREDMKTHAGGFSEDAFWLLGPSGIDVFNALDDDSRSLKSKAFRDSGLYLMRANDRYLLACCGEVGTGGVGNHKHNDLLSFELYAGDKAFIVDPGAYIYTRNPEWRNLFRSTQYHNTVVIDGHEQNRFVADKLFAMTDDSSLIVHEWVSTSEKEWLDVEHTGYSRLAHPVRHRRTFLFEKRTGAWTITDLLSGAGQHTAEWYFHFDHGIELKAIGDATFRTHTEGTNLEISAHSEILLTCELLDGWVSREYGSKLPARIIHMSGKFSSACRTQLSLRTL
jgi:hypothetical protein